MPVSQRNKGQTHQQEQEEAPNRPGTPSNSPCAQPFGVIAGAQTYRTISTSLVEAMICPREKLGAPKIVPMWWFDIDVAVAAKLGTKKNRRKSHMVYREDLHFQFQGLVETLLLYLIYYI